MQEKRYHIITYGCQMNIHESEKIAGILEQMGYTKTDNENDANIIVFNTCCIRETAENHAYGNIGALKQLKKDDKSKIVAVGGCMTQQDGAAEKLTSKFPFVDIVFGTHNLDKFGDLLQEFLDRRKRVIQIMSSEGCVNEGVSTGRSSFPNAWVNINYGCDNFCTYCIVPYVRGRERSRQLGDIVCEVEGLVKKGYKEITLLGQNVNSYGKDLQDTNFATLLRSCSAIDGKFRLRFMTNHPKDLTEDMVKAMAESQKVCKCIHLPVQAGSNKILKLMNRRYTREDYFEKVALLKKYMPECQITTDIMVGFPQEDENDFLDTLDLVKKCDFSSAFTFIYSKRSGTKANEMQGHISKEIKKQRIMQLVELVNKTSREKSLAYKGKVVEVLCEDFDSKKNMFMGRDCFNKMVYFASENDGLIGKFVNVKITKTGGVSLSGEIVL